MWIAPPGHLCLAFFMTLGDSETHARNHGKKQGLRASAPTVLLSSSCYRKEPSIYSKGHPLLHSSPLHSVWPVFWRLVMVTGSVLATLRHPSMFSLPCPLTPLLSLSACPRAATWILINVMPILGEPRLNLPLQWQKWVPMTFLPMVLYRVTDHHKTTNNPRLQKTERSQVLVCEPKITFENPCFQTWNLLPQVFWIYFLCVCALSLTFLLVGFPINYDGLRLCYLIPRVEVHWLDCASPNHREMTLTLHLYDTNGNLSLYIS